jgi:hypothetical protein
MIKHVVLFKFKADATPAQRKAMVDGLNALPGLIKEVKNWHMEETIPGRPPRSHSVALFCEFDNVAALESYIANQHHQDVVKIIDATCETRASFDYEG